MTPPSPLSPRKNRRRFERLPEPSLPKALPPHIVKAFKSMLSNGHIEKAFQFAMHRAEADAPVQETLNDFLKRYEAEAAKAGKGALDPYMPAFRAALCVRCLSELRRRRFDLAGRGVNPLFLQTWFQKRALAAMCDLEAVEVDRICRSAGGRPRDFVRENFERFAPRTCVQEFL